MQRPNPKDFFSPRDKVEIADTIVMHRHLLFIEPAAVAYFASAIISGGPVMLAGTVSMHADFAATLFNQQWSDPLAPKFHVPAPGDISDRDIASVRRMVSRSQGGVLDFVYFTGHGTDPFPRHAACALYTDTDVCADSRITHGPFVPYMPFNMAHYGHIGTTTKKTGPGAYTSIDEYLFSTDVTPDSRTAWYRTKPSDMRTTPTLCLRLAVGDDNMFRLSGTALDDPEWAEPYVEPGTDLMLDMQRPTGATCVYTLHRNSRDEP